MFCSKGMRLACGELCVVQRDKTSIRPSYRNATRCFVLGISEKLYSNEGFPLALDARKYMFCIFFVFF